MIEARTCTKYIIFVWCAGRWQLPDENGPHPGPYDLRSQAQAAVEKHAKREWHAMLMDRKDPLGPATPEEAYVAQAHRDYTRLLHHIFEARGFPMPLEIDPTPSVKV